MSHDTLICKLVESQENQIKAFELHRADMKAAMVATEKEIFKQHNCSFSDAPPHVLAIITQLRKDYNKYWSNDGILLNELMRRQETNRQKRLDYMT